MMKKILNPSFLNAVLAMVAAFGAGITLLLTAAGRVLRVLDGPLPDAEAA